MSSLSAKPLVSKTPRPLVLCILDGWGHSESTNDNAILEANTPRWDALSSQYPHSLLATSGEAVGLPEGQMGNSEVGHMNIGSGRVVMQELPRIDHSIRTGALASNPELIRFAESLKKTGGACHLVGLMSPGGVHAHERHVIALAGVLATEGIKVYIHAITDGRDTPPSSARDYIAKCESIVADFPDVSIATVSGRYYAMDRDNRWDRVEKAYQVIVEAKGEKMPSAGEAIEQSYQQQKTDEFLLPVAIESYEGMKDGDGIIMANYRSDRARQLLTSLLDPTFEGFKRDKTIKFAASLGMVEYSAELNPLLRTLFPAQKLNNILGEVLSHAGKKQLRIAETEKYAHVTFFFNGGKEEKLKGEERILVPSPKVATYDLQPEMSAPELTDKLVDAIEKDSFDVIIVNYANTDMVGHTGVKSAAIKAVEAVDKCLGRLFDAVEKAGGVLLVTADHGNAEKMTDEDTKQPHTAHTTGPVPFLVAGKLVQKLSLENGKLCDIAPTMLALLQLEQPEEMTGENLLHV